MVFPFDELRDTKEVVIFSRPILWLFTCQRPRPKSHALCDHDGVKKPWSSSILFGLRVHAAKWIHQGDSVQSRAEFFKECQ
jgi:hypothetical protein